MNINALQNSGRILWTEGKYSQSIQAFEEAIQVKPDDLSNYWYLGLSYLLQREEETAQLIWLSAIAEQKAEDSENIVQSLIKILISESARLSELNQLQEAWAIRQHLREFEPENLINIVCLIDLSLRLNEFSESLLYEYNAIELLQSNSELVDLLTLSSVLERVLQFPAEETLSFAEACVFYFPSLEQWCKIINISAADLAFKRRLTPFAIALIKLNTPENAVELNNKHTKYIGIF